MVIMTNILPHSIIAITIFPFIFVNKEKNITDEIINHERVHMRQQLECLFVFFFMIYFFEWIFKGYDKISFEREATENENNLNYLKSRKIFSWVKYF